MSSYLEIGMAHVKLSRNRHRHMSSYLEIGMAHVKLSRNRRGTCQAI